MMIMNKIIKNGRTLLGGLLLGCMAVSCTKDYFLDENNYWIYVPQIKDRSIQDFYVAFHDAAGNHLRTSRLAAADFNQPYVTDGIIRSKLKPGETNVMCFAQLNTIEVTEGQPLADSWLALPVVDKKAGIYAPGKLDCRMLQKVAEVLPIGHAGARVADTVDIKEDLVYLGTLVLKFKKLPKVVDRVEVIYSGLATRMSFSGSFTTFTPGDRVKASYLPLHQSDNEEFKDSFLPSSGTLLEGVAPERPPLGLEVFFYSGEDQVGYFTEKNLSENCPVTDGNGEPLPKPWFLEPRHTVSFCFEGFTMVSVQLVGWEDIGQGETTPV
ncbi:hypothetical protein DXA95_08710 [Odoribacter sp. OF09-27XD]|jgi:hypothetical protein|nr:hypothetical protein DXA95_08710 [Odoribacter sp. OF09-27XD]